MLRIDKICYVIVFKLTLDGATETNPNDESELRLIKVILKSFQLCRHGFYKRD